MEERCLIKKPMGCNCNHNHKVLEHQTGLSNLQPRHEPPTSGPRHLSHSSQIACCKEKKKTRGDSEGAPRIIKLLKFNPQCHANRAITMLQAHRLPQPYDCCKHYGMHQTLIEGQARLVPGHKLRIILKLLISNATECTKCSTNANRRPRH